MRFHPADEVSPSMLDFVARESRLSKVMVTVVMFLVTAGLLAVTAVPDLAGRSLGWGRIVTGILGVLIGLITLVSFSSLKAALGPSNWVLSFDGERLLVKFRSYMNHHYPPGDEVVVSFPKSEIAWIRKTTEIHTRYHPSSRGGSVKGSERTKHLCIKLRETDTGELAERLQAERRLEPLGGGVVKSRASHYPVCLLQEDLLRIDWRGQGSWLEPGLDEALGRLGESFQVKAEAELDMRGSSEGEAGAEIRDLALRGRILEAVKLCQERLGLTTTEAKAFVDGTLEEEPREA